MPEPARPGLKFNTLDDLLADVKHLQSGPYLQAGKWDLGFIIDHLTKSMNHPFAPQGMKNPPWPIRSIMGFFYCLFARRKSYPNFRIPVPGILAPTKKESVIQMTDAIEKVKNFPHPHINCPPFGSLPIQAFRQMQLLHGAHHLSYLKSES